jgi:2-keto-4-pentenoate hydratase/2-oxohepta-3-ene-1,7-dioic acid hydratase in catechol pathway
MRFVSFAKEGRPALAVRHEDTLVDLSALDPGLPRTLLDVLTAGPAAYEAVARTLAHAPAAHRLDPASVNYLPPLPNPGRIVCLGMNYLDHLDEVDVPMDKPTYPVLFSRFASSLVAHGEALVRPKVSTQFDFEGELVVVIGKAGKYLTPAQALDHVAGYSVFNDASVRDFQFKSSQWTIGKNFDGTGAFGPEFVTADELPPGAKGLRLQTHLNGQVMQDANTRDMIFDVATAVSLLSECFALQPGDLLVTGTPEGIGFARRPQVFMKAGDLCEIEIEGIGTLRNPVRDETT